MSKKKSLSTDCPCSSGATLEQCCGQYLEAGKRAPTAEVLMRSRYVAYVFNDAAYLRKTWHPDTCPVELSLDDCGKWIGLKILRTERGEVDDEQGSVEFVARYKVAGKAHRLHEASRFVRHEGCWVYEGGEASGSRLREPLINSGPS